MILSAHAQRTAEAMGSRGQRHLRLAAQQSPGWQHKTLGRKRGADIKNGWQRRVLDGGQPGRPTSLLVTVGRHGEQRLADMLHQPRRENRIVMYGGPVIVLARHVLCCKD